MGEHSRSSSTSSELGWEPAAEPHIGEHSPCQEIGRIYTRIRRSLFVWGLVCVNVHTFGLKVDWLNLCLHELGPFSVVPGQWERLGLDFVGVGGLNVRRFCLPSSILIQPPSWLEIWLFQSSSLACLRLVLLCLSVCTCVWVCMCDGGVNGGGADPVGGLDG